MALCKRQPDPLIPLEGEGEAWAFPEQAERDGAQQVGQLLGRVDKLLVAEAELEIECLRRWAAATSLGGGVRAGWGCEHCT